MLVPSHRSTNVLIRVEPLNSPTAKQSDVPGHDTFVSRGELAPKTYGLLIRDQLLPFQRSTSVFDDPELDWLPTARQNVPVHETPLRDPLHPGNRLAPVPTDHLVPFQCSTNVPPTAKQLDAF
jgi:hypothetical protein